ncbi:MAG: hypothetical protein ACRD01_10260 [Terriglobales bacterium]
MALREGETYTCSDPNCGCEIEVTRGCHAGESHVQEPRCCCGKEMKRAGEVQAA